MRLAIDHGRKRWRGCSRRVGSMGGADMTILGAIDSGVYDLPIAAVLVVLCTALLVKLLEGGPC